MMYSGAIGDRSCVRSPGELMRPVFGSTVKTACWPLVQAMSLEICVPLASISLGGAELVYNARTLMKEGSTHMSRRRTGTALLQKLLRFDRAANTSIDFQSKSFISTNSN